MDTTPLSGQADRSTGAGDQTHVSPEGGPRPSAQARDRRAHGALFDLGRGIAHRWWILVAALLVGIGAALAVSYGSDPQHSATATLLVTPVLGSSAGQADEDRFDAQQRVAGLPAVADMAAEQLEQQGVDPGEDVAARVDVRDRGSSLLEVEARADTAEGAAATANAYARAYLEFVTETEEQRINRVLERLRSRRDDVAPSATATVAELDRQIGQAIGARARSGADTTLVGAAEVSRSPASRHLVRNLVAGFGAALLLGGLAAWTLERRDRRLRDLDELEEVYGLPVVGRAAQLLAVGRGGSRVRRHRACRGLGLRSRGRGLSHAAGQPALLPGRPARPHGSILVASPLSGEGKSTVARVLAVVMAAMGDRVCLVDGDLRKGDLSQGVRNGRPEGLALVLAGFDLEEALNEVPTALEPVSCGSRMLVERPGGALPPNPSELLESERMRWLLGELEQRFDTVIIDSPAMASVSDALPLAGWVLGVLVVSSLGHTTSSAAAQLSAQLELVGARAIGVVANQWRPEPKYAYDYPAAAAARASRGGNRRRSR